MGFFSSLSSLIHQIDQTKDSQGSVSRSAVTTESIRTSITSEAGDHVEVAGDRVIETVAENPVLVTTAAVIGGAAACVAAPAIAAAAGSAALLGTTATTGTAISGLSGAALTNASLAALGGGAITAGGLGIAGGTATITGAVVQLPKKPIDLLSSEQQLRLIGARVKMSRLALKMSQDACAQKSGVSRTALRNLEEGKDTKLSTLLAVSKTIELPLQSWFDGD